MKKKLVAIILLLICISTLACTTKNKESDTFFYYNDESKKNFELIESGEKIPNNSYYTSIMRYKFEIKSEAYPLDKNYPLSIPFYIGEESNAILGFRSNAPFTYEKSINGFSYNLNIEYSGLELDKETGNRNLVLEVISNDTSINKIDPSINVNNMYSKDNKYLNYLDLEINDSVKSLADEIRNSLPSEKQDNLKSISYAYVTWILDNLYYPVDSYHFVGKYYNLNNSEKTLELRTGNCEDFSVLLTELLTSQGIIARRIGGYSPISFIEENNNLSDFGLHQLVEVYDGNEWIRLESTVYDIDNPIDFEVNGEVIKVLRGRHINSISVQAFIQSVILPHGTTRFYNSLGCELKDIDFLPLYN